MVRINSSLLFLFSLCCLGSPAQAESKTALNDHLFAVVNGEQITSENYLVELSRGVRQRFYHGNIPADEMSAFRQEIADKMVDELLLLQEAKRRNIEPDSKAVEAQLQQYDKRYGNSEQWQARREKLLPRLRTQLQNQSVLKRVKEALKQISVPNEKAVQKYYKDNPEKFTSPERRKISLILLKVDPSSPATVWDGARSEAKELIARIKAGESFAELAKIHSSDSRSAPKGGDMGYLHKGMLAKSVEEVLDQLKEGELSDPVTTLQGIVVVRLEKLLGAKLNDYEKVRERATDLLKRELSQKQYDSAVQSLREHASLQVNERLVKQSQ